MTRARKAAAEKDVDTDAPDETGTGTEVVVHQDIKWLAETKAEAEAAVQRYVDAKNVADEALEEANKAKYQYDQARKAANHSVLGEAPDFSALFANSAPTPGVQA